jgi:hypothetical protein
MPPDVLKLISHNHLLSQVDGGETAFIKAKEMGVSIVRYDFRWHQLATEAGWQWDTSDSNRWNDLLEPSLGWTKEHGMRTLVNLLAYSVPPGTIGGMNEAWRDHWASHGRSRPRELGERDCALWAAWADGHGVDLPSPREYTEALLDRLATGQAAGDFDIVGLCVLNEPNTKWPGEPNWRRLRIPGDDGAMSTYSTASYCRDMCRWVKEHVGAEHQDSLGHTVTVVNPYSYRGHWMDHSWRRVAADPNVDVLGIDIYWDQLFGLFAWGRPEAMRSVAEEHGKPWWLVETAGAHSPAWWRRPSCRKIEKVTDLCMRSGASVIGYYRLWGDYTGRSNYGAAYNILTDPGPDPTPNTDRRGNPYWETIRDI